MQSNNDFILDNLFKKKQPLFIVSSQRSKHEFYLRYPQKGNLDFDLSNAKENAECFDSCLQNCFELFDFTTYNTITKTQTFLPQVLTIAEFFQKITYTKYARIPKNIRDLFMFQAIKNVKATFKGKKNLGFLDFEQSFMLFLQTSSILLDFYDELKEHKIPITTKDLLLFDLIDSYGEYSEQLELLAKIYEKYTQLLKQNNLTDSLYSNDIEQNYAIFTEYIESFSSIHIELEGFISPLQHEILEQTSRIVPIFLHFKTDDYNITHFTILKKDLESHKRYIYDIAQKNIFAKNIQKLDSTSIKLYKSTHGFNQANLALYLAHKWHQEILDNNANENDFAIILPNESFSNHLSTLDSLCLLNFAMGISIQTTQSFSLLQMLYENFLESKTFILHDIFAFTQKHQTQEFLQMHAKALIEQSQDFILHNPTLLHLEQVLMLLFSCEEILLTQAISLLAELHFLEKEKFLNTHMAFEQLFIVFMRNFSLVRINDVGGGKIRVIGALEARNLTFKEVLILDFTDDYVPNVTHDDVFLNSKIRSHYNMPTRFDKENLYKHHYYNIMQNTQTTHISYLINEEKLPSNMLFELECNHELACSIDEMFSYYDKSKQTDQTFYDEEYPKFSKNEYSFLSASALNVYRECTRKFYFRYIEKLKEEDTTQTKNRGLLLHDWLYNAYNSHIGKVLTANDINCIKNQFFAQLQDFLDIILKNDVNQDIATFMALDKLAPKMHAFFDYEHKRVQEHKITILALEYDFTLDYKGFTLNGRIDRIDHVDDEIMFYDYKSGTMAPGKNDLQMPFYALCTHEFEILQKHSNLVQVFVYYVLGDKKDKPFIIKPESELTQGKQDIETILETFGQENKMTENKQTCKNCPYALLCNQD